MESIIENFYVENIGQSIEIYEKSHSPRFDFLIKDLNLDKIENSSILDVGCGYGPIFNRLPKDKGNLYIGIDGASLSDLPFKYHQFDLSYDKFSLILENKFDVVLSFETFEHLTNPYHCILEIKTLLKQNGLFFLSIPHEKTTHNTIYPGLLYPVANFVEFLNQCSFEILDIKIHDKAFFQNVFILRNKDWSACKMRWFKNEEKFRNIPPHISINL